MRSAQEKSDRALLETAVKENHLDDMRALLGRGVRPSVLAIVRFAKLPVDAQEALVAAFFRNITPASFNEDAGFLALRELYTRPGLLERVYPHAPEVFDKPIYPQAIPLCRWPTFYAKLGKKAEFGLVSAIVDAPDNLDRPIYDALGPLLTPNAVDAMWLTPKTWAVAGWFPEAEPADDPSHEPALAALREGRLGDLRDMGMGVDFLDRFPPLVRFGLSAFTEQPALTRCEYYAIDRITELCRFIGKYSKFDCWVINRAYRLGYTLFPDADGATSDCDEEKPQ